MDFGQAIASLKAGQRVARQGWNGKGMWLKLWRGIHPCQASTLRDLRSGMPLTHDGVSLNLFHCSDEADILRDPYTTMPCIMMRTASGSMVKGWLASQTDMLAEDWETVPPVECADEQYHHYTGYDDLPVVSGYSATGSIGAEGE